MILNFTSLFVVKDLNLLAMPCSPETTSCLLVKCKVQTLEDSHKDEKFDCTAVLMVDMQLSMCL